MKLGWVRLCMALFGTAGLVVGGAAAADPLTIRIARGAAAEEQVWLLKAKPELAPNQGKLYNVDMKYFPNPDQRFQALEAGALDISTSNVQTALFAGAANVPIKIVAGISRESRKGAYTKYFVKADSPLKSAGDLAGKTVGIVGLRSVSNFWAALAIKNAGLDPAKVNFVTVQFPLQGAALRSGQVDVATMVEPFASIEQKKGGIRQLFSSKDAVPFDEELIVLVARHEFLDKHADVVRAFLKDLQAVTDYYLKNRREARAAIIQGGMVKSPPEIYLDMPDWYREPRLQVDVELLKKTQDLYVSMGMQDKRTDVDKLVDLGFLPR